MLKTYKAGDFCSRECIELLKEADIVVTNPPFSLWRKFLAQLMEYKKKFLIIGNMACVSYKEVFPLLKGNKMWIGASRKSVSFKTSFSSVPKTFGNILWFANLKANYKVKPLDLSKKHYTPEKYPKYDNYDAINVDKVADIPCDYPGVMGIPLTFMDKYCPEQFEIVGISNSPETLKEIGIIGEKWITLYRQQGGKGHYSANMKVPVSTVNGRAVSHYNRIFIKNKNPQKKHS